MSSETPKPQTISDMIAEAQEQHRKDCSAGGRNKNAWQGFGEGLLGMLGLSGLSSVTNKSQDLLTKAQQTLQNVTNTSTLAFAQTQVGVDKDLLAFINKSNEYLNTEILGISAILQEEINLVSVEVVGAYLMIIMIFLYILYT